MIKKNWFFILTCLLVAAWTLAFYVDLKAEEDAIAEEEIVEESDNEDINDVIDDIRDDVEQLIELQKENNNDNAIYHKDNIKKYEDLLDKLNESTENNEKEEEEEVIKNQTRVVEADPPEEGTTQDEEIFQDDSNQNNDISDNAEYSDDFIQLHEDLQKIMISLWALAGLFLGSKLISRMFGNG